MRMPLSACLLVLCAAASLSAKPPALAEARRHWLRGSYGKAQSAFEEILEAGKDKSAAAVGLSRVLESLGEYDEALKTIDKALTDLPNDAGLLARRAEILHVRGRWDEAEKAADAAITAQKDQFHAHWVRAQLYRDRGAMKKADGEWKWFFNAYNNGGDIKDPEKLVLIGLASADYSRWHNASDNFNDILSDLFGVAGEQDKSYWPAEYEAGALLLEKYNNPEALKAFDKVLAINPSAAPALVGKGTMALAAYQIKKAEQLAEQALKINPNLPEALRLRADVDLALGDTAAALKELRQAEKINPRDERTLARVAACYLLQGKKDAVEAVAKEAKKLNPYPGVFYFELGERLEDRRRYHEARQAYVDALAANEQAVAALLKGGKPGARQPLLAGPANSLGMLYMRLGDEEKAGKLLDEAFRADPFNVRVSNQRKVLHHLQNYKTIETKHFILRYDPKNDEGLARYMESYLEDIYTDLAAKFQFRPRERILIEVFNHHDMFSGRVVALPDLHTIGACTGRMIALASPNAKKVSQPFNWARVLRHEIVHVFNLEQTNFLVPHWLTEGLAVSNEGFPRPALWNKLLLEHVPTGKGLMTLDDINLGFIRPRDQLQWNLAYCQSQLYVQYLKKKFGDEVIGKLLDAYRAGLETPAVIQKVCQVDVATFEKGYRAFLEETIKGIRGKPVEKRRTLRELEAEYEKKPDNADVAAELALRYLRNPRKARKLAEEALKVRKDHPKALYVLAQLAHKGGEDAKEKSLLERALNKDDPEPRVARTLGKLYYDGGSYDRAAEVYELGRKAEPLDNFWLQQLARVYARNKNKERLIGVLRDLVPTDAEDFEGRVRLARLLGEAGKHAEAEKYARQALEIDIRSAEARDMLVKALRKQNKNAEADRIARILEASKPSQKSPRRIDD